MFSNLESSWKLSASATASRRASSQLASTSQALPRWHAQNTFSYNPENYQQQGSQAKAISIPWGSGDEAEWNSLQGTGYQAPDFYQTTEKPVEVQEAKPCKPLRINRDLLLYRARMLRQDAFTMKTVQEKMECYQKSEAALQKCIDLDPTDARAYVSLGKLLTQQHRYDEARKVYEDGSAVTGGENEYVWQAWATMEARCGNIRLARKYFNAATLVNNEHAASWHAWGMLEKREGNLTTARDLWVKGIKRSQGRPNPHLYQSLAVLAGEMGFVDEARAWFKKGTSTVRGAQSHALWHGWGLFEERCGEPRIVRYLYKKGLEVSPRSRYIHLAWAMFEKEGGQVDNARELLQRGHALNPNDAAILQAWAVLEVEQGDVEEARRLFRLAGAAEPKMVHVWQAWGLLEMRQHNYQAARQHFQTAMWTHPGDATACMVWQAWAVLEWRAGNLGLARSMFKCAVKADPSSKKSWESWILMEEQLGEESRAAILRNASMQDRPANRGLPASFGVNLEALEAMDAANPLTTVMNTVNEWLRKFESKRAVATRRLPSYLRPPADEGLNDYNDMQPALPPMQEMMKLDSDQLELPHFPSREQLPRKRLPKKRVASPVGGSM